ncbi:putative polyprotein [Tanacetum coccineum]
MKMMKNSHIQSLKEKWKFFWQMKWHILLMKHIKALWKAKNLNIQGKGRKKRFSNEFVKTMSERFEKAIQDWLLLFSKVSIKHFNSIKEQNEVLKEKLVECENQIKKNQKEYSKGLQQISSELQESKPLTKREVLELVEEIAQQPKKVEEEALKLTSELEKKVKRIEDQVHRIEHLVKEVQRFLTT